MEIGLSCSLLVSFRSLDRAVQRSSGDLGGTAYLENGVFWTVIEGLGNTYLSGCQGFRSAAPSPSGCTQACSCSLPNEVSLKLSECAKDMKDKFPPAGCGINILSQAFEANPPLLKVSHR